jgi:hypothetical protein
MWPRLAAISWGRRWSFPTASAFATGWFRDQQYQQRECLHPRHHPRGKPHPPPLHCGMRYALTRDSRRTARSPLSPSASVASCLSSPVSVSPPGFPTHSDRQLHTATAAPHTSDHALDCRSIARESKLAGQALVRRYHTLRSLSPGHRPGSVVLLAPDATLATELAHGLRYSASPRALVYRRGVCVSLDAKASPCRGSEGR